MSFIAHKKDFQQKMNSLGHYSATIQNKALLNHFRITLKSNQTHRSKITSNGIIVDDTLTLIPFICDALVSKRDFLYMMDYWIGFAKLNQLSTIRLVPKIGASGRILKYWDDSSNLGFMKTALSLGFKNSTNHEFAISIEQSNILDVLDMRLTIEEVFESIRKEDLSFVLDLNTLPTSDSSFYRYAFRWRGASNQFLFFYEKGLYYLVFNEEKMFFDKSNLVEIIQSLLQQMEDSLRIKNLIEPPHDILLSLLTKHCGFLSILNPIAEEAMESFIQLGYTYEEVEAEAARLNEIKGLPAKNKLASLPYNERTLQFFNKYYFSIILKSNVKEKFIISENIDDVIQFHSDYFRNQLSKRFEEFK